MSDTVECYRKQIDKLFLLAQTQTKKWDYCNYALLISTWQPLQEGEEYKNRTSAWDIKDVNLLRCASVRILLMYRPFTPQHYRSVNCTSFKKLLKRGGVLFDESGGVFITRHTEQSDDQRNFFNKNILEPLLGIVRSSTFPTPPPWGRKCGGTTRVTIQGIPVPGLYAFVPKPPSGRSPPFNSIFKFFRY
jgi:hypothetical protein